MHIISFKIWLLSDAAIMTVLLFYQYIMLEENWLISNDFCNLSGREFGVNSCLEQLIEIWSDTICKCDFPLLIRIFNYFDQRLYYTILGSHANRKKAPPDLNGPVILVWEAFFFFFLFSCWSLQYWIKTLLDPDLNSCGSRFQVWTILNQEYTCWMHLMLMCYFS